MKKLLLAIVMLALGLPAIAQSDMTLGLVGSYDLTVDLNDGSGHGFNMDASQSVVPISFSSLGVTTPGDAFGNCAWVSYFDAGGLNFDVAKTDAWMVSGFVDAPSTSWSNCFIVGNSWNHWNPYTLGLARGNGGVDAFTFMCSDIDSQAWLDAGIVPSDTPHLLNVWHDPVTDTLHFQVDNGMPLSGSVSALMGEPVWTHTRGDMEFALQFDADTHIRFLRFWKGTDAIKSDADRTWLWNSGAGRSGSELFGTHSMALAKHGKGHPKH